MTPETEREFLEWAAKDDVVHAVWNMLQRRRAGLFEGTEEDILAASVLMMAKERQGFIKLWQNHSLVCSAKTITAEETGHDR